MICGTCQVAGDLNSSGIFTASGHMHDECEYPKSCCCQHATGGEWVKRGPARS